MKRYIPLIIFLLLIIISSTLFPDEKKPSKKTAKKKVNKVIIEEKILKPYVVFSGISSTNQPRSMKLITQKNEWAKLWLWIQGIKMEQEEYDYYYNFANVPEIDFDSCMVVAIFEKKGKIIIPSSPFCGFNVKEMIEDKKNFTIRLHQKICDIIQQTDSIQTINIPSTTIYTLIVSPRTSKKINLQISTKDPKKKLDDSTFIWKDYSLITEQN